MRALTLHQPWASLIAVGAKRIETRSWPVPSTQPVGTENYSKIAIHAGKTIIRAPFDYKPTSEQMRGINWQYDPNRRFHERVSHYLGRNWKDKLPTGCIVATAIIERCVIMNRENEHLWPAKDSDERLFGEYDYGRCMWFLTDIEPVDPPINIRGYQGLWTVPDSIDI